MAASRKRVGAGLPGNRDETRTDPAKGTTEMMLSRNADLETIQTIMAGGPGAEVGPGAARRSRPLKAGRRAGPPVLAGEDARAYRGRLKAWTGSLSPRNAVELYLVERAVVLSWQLDRVDRAQLMHLEQAPSPARPVDVASPHPSGFDESDRGERLRRHQLACGRALFRTLRAFSRLRSLGQVAGSDPTAAPDAGLSVAGDHPTATLLSGVDSPPSSPAGAPVDSGAPLAAIVAGIRTPGADTAGLPIPGPLAGAEGARARPLDGPDDDRDSAEVPTRRRAGRRIRQASWAGPGSSRGARSCPGRREAAEPDDLPARSEPRRRVGGYAVPMDPSVPVACADRIPVRLRREAAGTRRARAASCPS